MTVQEWIEAIANLQAIAQTGLQYGKDAYDGEPVLFPWRTARAGTFPVANCP